ncbi:uncharacterized protein LOC131445016 [Solea solea]|uniref:uncharacterized protein LOC131445016 n=1 Tax=Solea solea TaxID=90069 RepID=UPI00272A9C86|nr:uncharacterized protein LOC131445016 [Solea solea]
MFSSLHAKDGLVPGGYLTSRFSIYQVHSILGSGTYGKVAKCTRMKDKKTVAIKIMKQRSDVHYEVDALKKIKSLDPDKCNLVRWYNIFKDKGKFCLEFEHLDKSLLDFMMGRNCPIFLKEIRPIVQQLANALNHLKTVGIVHADLKLENVMLVNQLREPYRVKVIDFGLAVEVSAAEVGLNIQTHPYRSPEIILGLPFTEAIDMWSLGCIAATMYLGTLLYPGNNEYEVIRYIVKTQGQPPDTMLSGGQKTGKYFQEEVNSTATFWKLKTPEQVRREMGIKAKKSTVLKFTSLDDLKHILDFQSVSSADKVVEKTDRLAFVDMLKGMLQLDAVKRMTPGEVLDHDFLSMHHIASMYHHSNHVRSCFHIMDICKTKVPTMDSCKTLNGSVQQPLSRTKKLVPSCAVGSSMVQPHRIDSRPCTDTKGSHTSGIKVKTHDEDLPLQVPLLTTKSSVQERSAGKLHQCHISDSKYNWLALKEKGTSDPSVGLPTSNCRSQRLRRVPSEFKRSLDLCHIYDTYPNLAAHNKKRTSEGSASLSTSNCRSLVQRCVSSKVKPRLDLCQKPKPSYIGSAHGEKRASDPPAASSTSNCRSQTQSYVLSEVKRRLDHCRTSDSYHNLPARSEKRASECSAGLSTSNNRNQTRACVLPEGKGKLDPCLIPKPIYNSALNEKKASDRAAGLPSSNCGSQTRRYVSEVKGRLIQRQIPKSIYNNCSAHKKNGTTDHFGGLSTANYRSWAQNCVSSEVKRRLDRQISESLYKWSTQNEKRVSKCSAGSQTSNHVRFDCVSSEVKRRLDCQIAESLYNCSARHEKRAGDPSVHLSTSKYRSWARNSVPSEIKRRLDYQIPKSIYIWSSYKEGTARDSAAG